MRKIARRGDNGGMDVLTTFRKLVRAALPRIDYYATYFGKVVKWHSGDQTIDITPTDPRLPGMAGIPFRHGLPGVTADVAIGVTEGATVAITWLNGDPSQPVAFLWGGGEHVLQLTLNADLIALGGTVGAEAAAKAVSMAADMATFLTALTTYVTAIQPKADPGPPGPPPGVFTPPLLLAIGNLAAKLPTWAATNVVVK